MGRPSRYSPEVRERAVRLALAHERDHDLQWAAIGSIEAKIGCSAETLRHWVRYGQSHLRCELLIRIELNTHGERG